MKRSNWVRLIAVILVISMLAAPVSAATVRAGEGYRTNSLVGSLIGLIRDVVRDIIDDWFDRPGKPTPTNPTTPVEPTEPSVPEETQPVEPEPTEPVVTEPTEPEVETVLELVEGHNTTENGQLLRGVTYSLSQVISQQAQPSVSYMSLRTPVQIKSSTPTSGLSVNAVTTTATDDTDITSGLLAHYDFETVTDNTVSNNVTTNTTTTAVLNGSVTVEETDHMGNAIQFNGGGLQLTNIVNATTSSFSVSMWYKAGNNAHYNLIQAGTIDGSTGRTILLLNSDSKYFTYVTGDNARVTTGAIDRSVWQHITFSYDKDTNKAYFFVNGVADNADGVTLSGSPLDTADMIFGRHRTTSDPFNGLIDEVRVYNKVLTAAEAAAVYAYDPTATPDPDPIDPTEPETNANLVYIPVTMFNYDMDTMNDKTISMYEEGSTLYSGIHFSDGKPGGSVTYAVTAHTGEYTNGQYVIQNYLMKDINQPSWLTCTLEGEKGITSTANQADAAIWTLTRRPGANVFTLTTEIDGTTYYMTMGNETSGVTTEYSEITLVYYTHTNAGIQITKDGYYLAHSEGNLFCGSTNSTSTSNGMGFFPVAEDGTIGTTARTVTTINGAVTSGFSRWNWWSYLEDGNAAQNKFFAELVQHELDENGDIVFNVIEPGIFKTGTGENIADKDVYTNVGLPFVLDETTGIYSFDSDRNGVYFADKDGDGDSDPASGTETNLELLTFEPDAPQGWSGMNYGDGSSKLWAPFNTNVNDDAEDHIDYHFGMRADIPFSMTPNGRIKSTDDNSDPITFTFSGDDDVWVFIDGHLVIDLGGIHNRIGATIDFANNTITYFLPESNKSTAELGCYNDRTRYPLNADGKTITVKLYNDAEGEGSLGQTRLDFSSEEEHTMSVFYMERGKGTSNCHIDFNLPMRDTVVVTKDITKSWSEAQDEADGENGDGTAPLTAKEQATVDKLDFNFKLYKKEKNGAFTVVANTNYFLLDKDNKVVGTRTTGADGMFTLKNGQSAKFMTDISKDGITYYVEELGLDLTTFLTPDYNYRGLATNGFDYTGIALDTDSDEDNATKEVNGHVSDASQIAEHELPMNATELKSYDITAYGSIEAIDSLQFICTNYLNADLPNPTARAYEDIIVIDYGLPVQIDPLHNDVFRGDRIEIVAWGDESLTLDEVLIGDHAVPHDDPNAEEKTSWDDSSKLFHSGNVTFNDVTYSETEIKNEDGTSTFTYTRDTFDYQLTKQLTEVEVIHYIIQVTSGTGENALYRYALGKIHIVPATIMYYEENFSDMILFEGKAWNTDVTVADQDNVSLYQEPGVAGNNYDSTYGSDVAYLSDDGDSNGTYRFANTSEKAARFTYTFTGTGTSFFARTSANTGYLQIKLFTGTDTTASDYEIYYCDTYYKDRNTTDVDAAGTLYNIPVFTREDLPYGTYTVVCTVAKAGTITDNYKYDENGDLVFDENGNPVFLGSGSEFYLDGIRVMQPLNESSERDDLILKAHNAYSADGETNLDTVTLREKLISDVVNDNIVWTEDKFVVMTDIDGAIVKAEDYISVGPNEEVYLAPGQKVTFSLKSWYPEGLKLYMGMKAPFGTASVNVGHKNFPLNNAPDCYYDVTDNYESMEELTDEAGNTYYVVTYSFEVPANAGRIVSLTNIKVVGNYEFTIVPNSKTN